MPTYTVLQRNDQMRAEQDADVIYQLGLCGYVEIGFQDADTAEQAVSEYHANNELQDNYKRPLGLRWLMWVGGGAAFCWFTYLIFFLLPLAFQD